MTLRTLKITAVVLLFQALTIVPALAQDFNSLMSSAASTNQQFLDQTNRALEATDLATLQARTRTAVATGQQLESLLRAALAAAPDDASRSRAQGALTHITAAVQSGQAALQATDFGSARGFVDAMRGEAMEALSELAPFARAPQAPAALPRAGDASSAPWAVGSTVVALALSGGLAALVGLGLRRKTA